MTQIPGITLENKVLCEDVRQEKSNKYILVGVYSGDILIGAIPAHISLSLFFEFIAAKAGVNTLELKISGPGEGQVTMHLGYETANKSQVVTVVTPRMEVLMECEGILRVELSADGKNWMPLITKTVTQADGLWSLAPTASVLPSEQSPPDAPGASSPL